MAYSFNKLWAAMAVSLATAAGVVSADSIQGIDPGWYNGPGNVNSCNPCVRPVADCCGNFYFSAEALFWRAHEDGLGYARRILSTQNINSNDVTAIEIENPHFNWDTGFRLGLGYEFTADNWDLVAYWTHFRTSANRKAKVCSFGSTDESLLPIWSNVDISIDINGNSTVNSIHPRWRLTLDLADFEIGREFCVCSSVTFRPFVGVRAAWIKQTYCIFSEVPTSVGASTANTDEVELYSKFNGVGLRSGFGSQWNWCYGFSIYGSAAASILYGELHAHTSEYAFTFSGEPFTGSLEEQYQRDNRHTCRFAADAALGLRWKQCFCDDTLALTFQLGWEQHIFFDQNRFEIAGDPDPQEERGDLCVQGITFGAWLDF